MDSPRQSRENASGRWSPAPPASRCCFPSTSRSQPEGATRQRPGRFGTHGAPAIPLPPHPASSPGHPGRPRACPGRQLRRVTAPKAPEAARARRWPRGPPSGGREQASKSSGSRKHPSWEGHPFRAGENESKAWPLRRIRTREAGNPKSRRLRSRDQTHHRGQSLRGFGPPILKQISHKACH